MDSNVKALLHVQSSLLLALCATHPDAPALEQSFDFHLAQSLERVSSSQEMRSHIDAWAKTFRVRMERGASQTDEGESPTTTS
jgi:starvation-inducible outer membrane lipoprotein